MASSEAPLASGSNSPLAVVLVFARPDASPAQVESLS
jgi:hypothetical protein